jgi:RNA polymerase sigma factor (sigma-70 family)
MLHATFARGLKYLLARKLGTDCEDGIHETLLVVLKAIRDGKIREPERLPGFVRTVAMRYAFGIIGQRVRSRESELPLETGVYTPVMAEQNPEQQAIIQERAELIRQTLEQMSRRDREILERFYLHEQTPEQICELMQLTETQFRLLKSRAKAKFGELGNKKVNKRRPTTVSIRNGYSVSISPSLS